MRRGEMGIGDIIVEALSIAAVLIYLGLQIVYRQLYGISADKMLYHFLPVILLYAGMMVVQFFPELLNGRNSEPLKGKVRIYAVRMVRICKLLLILGILLPSISDVCGVRINEAYSLIGMVGVLAVIGYYLYRIWQYNKSQNKHKK